MKEIPVIDFNFESKVRVLLYGNETCNSFEAASSSISVNGMNFSSNVNLSVDDYLLITFNLSETVVIETPAKITNINKSESDDINLYYAEFIGLSDRDKEQIDAVRILTNM